MAIYDCCGNLQCRYVYDAWGNHKIYGSNGAELSAVDLNVGNTNPFRYRGYYWDKEFSLYYLKTRYYDPALGRFISADDISYLNPESIQGLNLYAYCENNPVMGIDPDGTVALAIFLTSLILGGIIGAISGGVNAAEEGENIWKGALIGGLKGIVKGGAFGLGAGIGLATTSIVAGLAGFAVTAVGSFAAGMGIYALGTQLYDKEFYSIQMLMEGFRLSLQSSMNYGVGYLFGRKSMFRQAAKLNCSSPKMFLKSTIFRFKHLLPNMIERLYLKTVTATVFSWYVDKIFDAVS